MSIERGVHYLLFSEARFDGATGSWRFVLSEVGGSENLAAADVEPITCRERLELLAVVRGLEAIDRPARVTLVTNSRYVNRGLKHGLTDWRACHWQWERFGQLVPVRDGDLWRRVDRALQFHEMDCRLWHFDTQLDDAGALSTDADAAAYPIRNLRRRGSRSARWDACEPAELAAG
jgi:ribonuclease HI